MADGRVVIEAILDATNVTRNVKNLSKDLKNISWKDISTGTDKAKELSSSFKAAGTACTAKLTAPIVAAGAAAFKTASDYGSATSRIQAAFGATREEAERFKDIGATIYEGGWGESLDDVTSALIQTKSTIRDIDDQGLETITQNALVLSDVFDADVNESIRGTNALMEGFGLTAEQASDLLAAGMQNGLNYTDELADNLAEYSVRWGQAGVSASEYFSMLEAGASNGAYNLDKVGDFLNEFLTSLSDGRLEENMASFSQGTKNVFDEFKAGKATAQDVLNAVISDMQGMTSETDRAALAGSLWSSLGEDNAMGMILAMGNVEDKYADVTGAANDLANAAGDNFASKMESAKRTIMGSLEPLGEPLTNIASAIATVVGWFGNLINAVGPVGQVVIMVILGILAAVGPLLSFVGTLITVLPQLSTAIGVVKTALSGLSGAFSFMTGPVGIIITIIGVLVGLFMYLWNTNEDFRNAVMEIWNAICGAFEQAGEFIGGIMSGIGDFFTNLGEDIGTWAEDVANWWTDLGNKASEFGSNVQETLGDTFNQVVTDSGNAFESVKNGMIDKLSQAQSSAVSIANQIGDKLGFPGLGDTVNNVFEGIKSLIEDPVGTARDFVKNAAQKITGFFSGIRLELPHIKLPHFSISGTFSLNPPQIPSIGVKWYAKGAIFNKASIIGVGEAGNEGVIPLSGSAMRPFAQTIAEEMPEGKNGGVIVNVEIRIANFNNNTKEDLDNIVDRIVSDIQKKIERKNRARGLVA